MTESRAERVEQDAPSTEIAIAYTIPFTWGRLRVSEAADEAYGLAPNASNLLEGDVETADSDSLLRITLDLLTVSELSEESQQSVHGMQLPIPDKQAIGIAMAKDIASTRHGVHVRLALDTSHQELRACLFESDPTPMAGRQAKPGAQDVARSKYIEDQVVSQTLARLISSTAVGSSHSALEEWSRKRNDARHVDLITKIGGVSIGVASGLIELGLISGNESAMIGSDSVAIGLIVGAGLGIRKAVKQYFQRADERSTRGSEIATKLSIAIGHDILTAYTTKRPANAVD